MPLPEVPLHFGCSLVHFATYFALQICGLNTVQNNLQPALAVFLAGINPHRPK